MTIRTAKVVLSAEVGSYIRDIRRAADETTRAADVSERAWRQSGAKAGKRFASSAKSALIAAGGVYAAADFTRDSVRLQADFDQTMRTMGAVAQVPKRELRDLGDLALQLGAGTSFSASEASGAMLELAKGGLSAATIEAGGLAGTLDLAAAGGTDLAQASTIAANALNVFGLEGRDMSQVADALAGGANASTASIESLGMALSQASGTASSTGLSLNETVGVLAAFDQAGIKGSDAGTSLKTMLASLTPSSDAARSAMDRLGLSFTKRNGEFRSITDIADQLQDKLGGLSAAERSQALQTIFGSDARRAANVLVNEGAEGLTDYIAQTEKAGSAEKVAAERMSGTAGSLERLSGSWETLKLRAGIALAPIVEDLADAAGPALDRLGDWFEADGADGLARFGTYLKNDVLPPARELAEELGPIARESLPALADALEVGADAFSAVLGPAGSVLDLFNSLPEDGRKAALGVAAVAIATGKLSNQVPAGLGSLTAVRDRLGEIDRRAAIMRTGAGLAGSAAVFGSVASEAEGSSGAMSGLLSTLGGAATGFAVGGPWGAAIGGGIGLLSAFTRGNKDAQVEVKGLSDEIDAQTGKLSDNGRALVINSMQKSGVFKAGRTVGLDADTVTAAAFGDRQALAAVEAQLDSLIAKYQDARRDMRPVDPQVVADVGRFRELLGGVTDEVADSTQKSRDAATANQVLRDQMALTSDVGKSLANSLGDVPRDLIIDVATPGAIESRKDVVDLARQYDLTPKQLRTIIRTAGLAEGKKDVREFAADVERRVRNLGPYTIDLKLSAKAVKAGALLQGARDNPGLFGLNKADGGEIPMNMGQAGVDSVPAMLMPGEHVFTTAEVDRLGGQGEVYRLRRMIRDGSFDRFGDLGAPGMGQTVQRFAQGGAVNAPVRVSANVDTVGLGSALATVSATFDQSTSDITNELSKVANRLFSLLGGGVGGLTPEQVLRGQQFARSQVGKPYVWGGVGPGGYDCSGFVSAVLNAALGMNPYSRRGATGSMPWAGFRSGGGGAFDVGWFTGNPGHTAARIGNLNVESYGGHGPAVGSGARGPGDGMFNRRMSYAGKRDAGGSFPSGSFVANISGRPEWVLDPASTARYARGGAVSLADRGRDIGTAITMDRGDSKPSVLGTTPTVTDAMRKALRDALREFELDKAPSAEEVKSEVSDLLGSIEQSFGAKSKLYLQADRLGDKLLKSATALEKEIARRDELAESLRELKEQRASEAASIAEGFMPDVLGDFAIFDDDDRRPIVDRLADAFDTGRSVADETSRYLQGARARGLNGPLYDELARSNNLSLQSRFSTMSRADIDRLEKAYAARSVAAAGAGQVATVELGTAVAALQRDAKDSAAASRALTQVVVGLADRLEAATERGSARGTATGFGALPKAAGSSQHASTHSVRRRP